MRWAEKKHLIRAKFRPSLYSRISEVTSSTHWNQRIAEGHSFYNPGLVSFRMPQDNFQVHGALTYPWGDISRYIISNDPRSMYTSVNLCSPIKHIPCLICRLVPEHRKKNEFTRHILVYPHVIVSVLTTRPAVRGVFDKTRCRLAGSPSAKDYDPTNKDGSPSNRQGDKGHLSPPIFPLAGFGFGCCVWVLAIFQRAFSSILGIDDGSEYSKN